MKIAKRILSLAAATLCTASIFNVVPFSVNAETSSDEMQYGEYLYYKQVDEDDDGTYDHIEIRDCDKSVTEVEIPEEIDVLPVTSLGICAFYNCQDLKIITIPDSVTIIKSFAFEDCFSLENITIPNSVTVIKGSAFFSCSSLKSITIPAGVTSIEGSAFEKCSSLESIIIENSKCKIYNSQYTISDTAAIYGYENSTAQEYAENYSRTFVILMPGDANGDGKITALDAAVIAKTLAQAGISGETVTVEDCPNADFNGDGKITALDASAIAKYLAEKAIQQ